MMRDADGPAGSPEGAGAKPDRPAWIDTVGEAEAEGELADIYRRFGPHVDHVLRAESLNPPVLRGHYDLYRAIMFGRSPLTRIQREMIAVSVSLLNGCHY